MSKIVLITGATSGIGEACARMFAKDGYRLLLNGRRAERLLKLEKELAAAGSDVFLIPFDVRDARQVTEVLAGLPEEWRAVDVLVNNAGLSQGLEPIHQGSTDDWDRMIDTNVKGLLYVTRIVSAGMVERKRGHIVNIGSIAGKETYLNGNVYCASKHAVDSLNKAMRIDLLPYGIKVTAIHPGAVETEFSEVRFKGDTERARKVYEGFEPLHAEDIADAVRYAVSLPAHVNINELLIMPTAQANSVHLHRN